MSPPENANARRLTWRRETQTDRARSYRRCPYGASRAIRMLESFLRYGREVCVWCGATLRWLPKPETAAKRAANCAEVTLLQRFTSPNAWERSFLLSLEKLGGKFSPGQQAKLDQLCEQHLKAVAP
jgi:hypothetical protein